MHRPTHSPRRLLPHNHNHHHHHPSRRDLITHRRSPHDSREPWYGDSIHDPSSDDNSLFFSGTDSDDDAADDDGSLASLPTFSSISRLPHARATRRPVHHHQPRRGHTHGRDSPASSPFEGRGGGINRVPGRSPRDRWRTGWDLDGYGGDDGAAEYGSYHRRRPEDVTEESW